MADCGDINKRLAEKEEELRNIREMRAKLQSANEAATAKTDPNTNTLKTYTGDEVSINTQEWNTRSELESVEMGDERIIGMVADGFANSTKPAGETGRMINYRQLDPSKENVAALLEVMGLRRANTPKGIELKRPFSQQAAGKGLIKLASDTGANPRDLAQNLSKKFKNIDNLPISVYAVAKARWETSTEFADVLETMADAMDQGTMSAAMRAELGNAARWAHYFEQMDAAVRRKVAQALRSLQFKLDDDIVDLVDINKDVTELTFDDIAEGSLLAQVIEHVDNGDAMSLRRIAKAKRVLAVTDAPINEPNFATALRVLNTYRKNNLFSSVSSFGVRNLSSGWVAAHLTVDDVVNGAMRVGPLAEWHAMSYGAKKLSEGFSVAFRNGWDSLTTGKSRMAVNALRDIDPKMLAEGKLFVENSLSKSWSDILEYKNPLSMDNPLGIGTVLNAFNLINGSVNYMLGKLVEKTTGTSAGYLASFRLLNGGDEIQRTMAWNWKTSHEAMLRAIEEYKDVIDPDTGRKLTMQQIEEIAEKETQKLLFSGYMTDNDLAKFRKERNATLGIPAGKEVDSETLRLEMFNNLNGVPNMSEDLAKVGVQRMEDVTFTGKLPSGVAGLQMLRANPLIGWLVPVFRSSFHGLSYIFRRNAIVSTADYLLKEVKARKGVVTKADVLDARAKAVTSVMLGITAFSLWQAKRLTDGGPSRKDPAARDAWLRRNQMYSLDLGFGPIPATRAKVASIDFFDLLGMQADIFRAIDEGMDGGDAEYALQSTFNVMANVLNTKAGLTGMTSFMNAATQPDRYDMSWALQRQASGVMPYTGIAGNFSRASKEPGAYPDERRHLSPEDAAAIGQSELGAKIKPLATWLGDAFLGNYPFYDEATQRPYKEDWTGGAMLRPFGLPMDATIPYTPLLPSQNRGLRWLEKHGFGGRPRPDNKVSGTTVHSELAESKNPVDAALVKGMSLTMTNDENAIYREAYKGTVGTFDPEAFGLSPDITKYVVGKDLQGALEALADDDALNMLLSTAEVSPSRQTMPTKTLPERLGASPILHKEVYKPVEDVLAYYDRIALLTLYRDSDTFAPRYEARVKKLYAQQIEQNKALSALEFTRQ